ncbi:hypothetical protein T01_3414 [Trichinella spiralis]|uniref:Uncharacterized protein n=1 Tax=Trichinella spiralis TaxID=6334 RepID=A0A0V1AH93_TRISP|nr:hypothetical protein T01_3414 [Trichinella spiralis]
MVPLYGLALQGIYTVNRYTNSGKQLLLPILRISTSVSPHRCQTTSRNMSGFSVCELW